MKILRYKEFNEKLNIKPVNLGKFIDKEYARFCKSLEIQESPDAKRLFDWWNTETGNGTHDKDIVDIMDTALDNVKDELYSTYFGLTVMLCAMLAEDGYDMKQFNVLGYKSYRGSNNPYDFSWFEGTDKNNNTVLDYVQNLYTENKRFKMFMNELYDAVKACRVSVDAVWCFYDKFYDNGSEPEWDVPTVTGYNHMFEM